MKKEAFNKENPIELMSQLMKVLYREGLEDSVSIIKQHKILKAINDEWQENRRMASPQKKASPSLFDQLQFASGSEKKQILTDMSDYGVNIIRGKFDEMGITDRRKQEEILMACLKEATAARLKADKDSLRKFGRIKMKHFVVDANGDKIRLGKKLRFGIFFQLVGKGFIK